MNRQYYDRELVSGRNTATASKSAYDKVWQRDKGICVYCGNPADVLDHVIRWADNGPGITSNLVCSCQKCNTYKASHPRGLKLLTRAIFWLMTHDEDVSWMDRFYPDIERSLKRPKIIIDETTKPKPRDLTIQKPIIPRNHKTRTIAFRLPNAVMDVLERRAGKQGLRVSDYLRARVIYDTNRNHGGK